MSDVYLGKRKPQLQEFSETPPSKERSRERSGDARHECRRLQTSRAKLMADNGEAFVQWLAEKPDCTGL